MNRSRRTVIEVRDDLHTEVRKLALLNDIRIYELANAVLEDFLNDNERANALIKRLRLQRSVSKSNGKHEKRKGR